MEDLRTAVREAERELGLAEAVVVTRRNTLMALQKQLQEEVVRSVGGLKTKDVASPSSAPAVKPVEDEDTRRARVRRRWRVLALKVKFGLGASVLALKKRNMNDISTFIDKESEEATVDDQMDLEGKCMRKKVDKRHFRKGGVRVGCTQGRDVF